MRQGDRDCPMVKKEELACVGEIVIEERTTLLHAKCRDIL